MDDIDGTSGSYRDRTADVLAKFHALFVGPNGTLGCAKVTQHRILMTSDRPVRVPLSRLARGKRVAAEAAVDEISQRVMVDPSSSWYPSLVVLIPRKYGSLRYCVHCRKLNEIAHKDAYPLPCTADLPE